MNKMKTLITTVLTLIFITITPHIASAGGFYDRVVFGNPILDMYTSISYTYEVQPSYEQEPIEFAIHLVINDLAKYYSTIGIMDTHLIGELICNDFLSAGKMQIDTDVTVEVMSCVSESITRKEAEQFFNEKINKQNQI